MTRSKQKGYVNTRSKITCPSLRTFHDNCSPCPSMHISQGLSALWQMADAITKRRLVNDLSASLCLDSLSPHYNCIPYYSIRAVTIKLNVNEKTSHILILDLLRNYIHSQTFSSTQLPASTRKLFLSTSFFIVNFLHDTFLIILWSFGWLCDMSCPSSGGTFLDWSNVNLDVWYVLKIWLQHVS